MNATRREFLASALAVGVTAALAACSSARAQAHGLLLSAYEDQRGDQFVGGVRLSGMKLFGARIPMRAHGCTVHPQAPERVLFFARRPGTHAFELTLDTSRVRQAFVTPEGRHLAGHGVFSHDGRWLFTPESDYENERGVIAVRDARDYRIAHEFASGGIDPHEVLLVGEQLVVANGGILTHPRSFRRKLNIDSMDPSLCLLNASTGVLEEQCRLPDHKLSIRHLSSVPDDWIIAGLQYEGPLERTPALVARYSRQEGLRLLPMPPELRRAQGYVASVVASDQHDLALASCPRGDGIATWQVSTGEFKEFIPAREVYGLSRDNDGALFASQRDGVALQVDGERHVLAQLQTIRWDDHWRWHEDTITVRA